jgi:hypothetical protein
MHTFLNMENKEKTEFFIFLSNSQL